MRDGKGREGLICGVVLMPCTAISVRGMVLEADAQAIRRIIKRYKGTRMSLSNI